jgi:hypothetical protein
MKELEYILVKTFANGEIRVDNHQNEIGIRSESTEIIAGSYYDTWQYDKNNTVSMRIHTEDRGGLLYRFVFIDQSPSAIVIAIEQKTSLDGIIAITPIKTYNGCNMELYKTYFFNVK